MTNAQQTIVVQVLKELAPEYCCECDTEPDRGTGALPKDSQHPGANFHGEYFWGEDECRYCKAHRLIALLTEPVA